MSVIAKDLTCERHDNKSNVADRKNNMNETKLVDRVKVRTRSDLNGDNN